MKNGVKKNIVILLISLVLIFIFGTYLMIQEDDDYLWYQRDTLPRTSYADNLQFIKNNPHKDSVKIPLKLAKYWLKKG